MFIDILRRSDLFQGIDSQDIKSLLKCLQADIIEHKKGEIILAAGTPPEHVGILLRGQLHVIKYDIDGNRSLLTALSPPDIFAESLCCSGINESPVTVVAEAPSTIMLMKFTQLLHTCPNSCEYHRQLIANMLGIIARKNIYLQDRFELVRMKSIRAKVLGYLGSFAARRGGAFAIPLNREQMADYLCTDRSALSHELIKMKRDGLIDYNRNIFTLK